MSGPGPDRGTDRQRQDPARNHSARVRTTRVTDEGQVARQAARRIDTLLAQGEPASAVMLPQPLAAWMIRLQPRATWLVLTAEVQHGGKQELKLLGALGRGVLGETTLLHPEPERLEAELRALPDPAQAGLRHQAGRSMLELPEYDGTGTWRDVILDPTGSFRVATHHQQEELSFDLWLHAALHSREGEDVEARLMNWVRSGPLGPAIDATPPGESLLIVAPLRARVPDGAQQAQEVTP